MTTLEPIRPANDAVAMAGVGDKLFAATRDNQLWLPTRWLT
jgi:hypothetical protein